MGVLDKLNSATRARRTHTLCLDAGLQSEHDALLEQLDDAVNKDAAEASLSTPTANLSAVVDQLEDIRDRMAESQVTFTIEGMDWTQRVALQAKHPPRGDQILDQLRGYNLQTFLPDVIKQSTVSVEDADGDIVTNVPDETWLHLLGDPSADPPVKGTLNFGGVNRLSSIALAVNDEDTAVPRSARSLLESQDSGASLAQPSPGTSPQNGSRGGSPRTSQKSSATKKAASSAS